MSVSDGRFEELFEVFVTFLVLIACFAPLCDGFAMENEDMEEGVEEEDDIWFDRDAVKQNGLRRDVKGVGHEGWLYHDQGVVDVFLVQDMPGK